MASTPRPRRGAVRAGAAGAASPLSAAHAVPPDTRTHRPPGSRSLRPVRGLGDLGSGKQRVGHGARFRSGCSSGNRGRADLTLKASGLLRAGWNLVDQVISSATNALLAFLIARSVSDSDFGGFSVAFTIFSVFIGLCRAVAASPLGIRFARSDTAEFRRAAAAGVGAALAVS